MTAKRREAMAAPEMSASAMIRRRDDVFATVAGEISSGNMYAVFVVITTAGATIPVAVGPVIRWFV